MTRVQPSSPNRSAETDPEQYALVVSDYDRVASLLVALLFIVGAGVLMLFILWLSTQIFAREPAVPVIYEEIGEGDGSLGEGMKLDAPDAEELGLDVEFEEPQLEETMAVIADAVAAKAAVLDNPLLTNAIETGRGGSTGSGHGLGRGDGTGTGRGGKPRHWEVRFAETGLDEYARQLDFFNIELGVLLPGNRVIYAKNLANERPTVHEGKADEEKRYYLTWTRGELERADRELLDKAGVKHQGRLVLKFLTREVEGQLIGLERARAGPEADNVRATYFGTRMEGDGYAFYVIDQVYK